MESTDRRREDPKWLIDKLLEVLFTLSITSFTTDMNIDEYDLNQFMFRLTGKSYE